jgi:hypothetical protein
LLPARRARPDEERTMTHFAATSRCECQALLSATLDHHHQVLEGSAQRLSARELAPAHSILWAHAGDADRFEVAWLCPFCGRNVLRAFYVGALRRVTPDGDVTNGGLVGAG